MNLLLSRSSTHSLTRSLLLYSCPSHFSTCCLPTTRYTFVGETVTRAVCQLFVMVCFAMLHTWSRPFAQPAVQHVQTALLSALCLIAMYVRSLSTY